MKVIAVNATALNSSGALTILRQFIYHASKEKDIHFYIYISGDVEHAVYDNITYMVKKNSTWLSRIFWDMLGFSRDIKKNINKTPTIISLQNTTINNISEQYVYIHQSIPFTKFKINLFKLNDFKILLYKYFYSFFIFLYSNDNTKYIVQTNWMKDAILNKKDIKKENVIVICPDVNLPLLDKKNSVFSDEDNSLIYPATCFSYKNHFILLKSLYLIEKNTLNKKVKLKVTFNEGDYVEFDNMVSKLNLKNNIIYLGVLSYSDLICEYKRSSILVFPSYIETVGLPLAEAATLGMNILCSDLPYARDLLNDYECVTYITFNDSEAWKDAIVYRLNNLSISNTSFKMPTTKKWNDFFEFYIKSDKL
ncbi:glycosyltransferase [Photobacterium damselae]|uniref:glycosyltransferase n=1 Tax=Photobacterium damselae TaxID=38293 RepID=UPI002543D4BC